MKCAVLPSIHDTYCFFRRSRRGVVSLGTVVHITVTSPEPWNVTREDLVLHFASAASPSTSASVMFDLYAFDIWSPRLLGIRL